MTSSHERENELYSVGKRLSAQLRATIGVGMTELNPDAVPAAIRPLLRHAEVLGIGDDRVRGKLFDIVPPEYLVVVKQMIAACPELKDWYLQSEATDRKHLPEVAAIGWMLMGLNVTW